MAASPGLPKVTQEAHRHSTLYYYHHHRQQPPYCRCRCWRGEQRGQISPNRRRTPSPAGLAPGKGRQTVIRRQLQRRPGPLFFALTNLRYPAGTVSCLLVLLPPLPQTGLNYPHYYCHELSATWLLMAESTTTPRGPVLNLAARSLPLPPLALRFEGKKEKKKKKEKGGAPGRRGGHRRVHCRTINTCNRRSTDASWVSASSFVSFGTTRPKGSTQLSFGKYILLAARFGRRTEAEGWWVSRDGCICRDPLHCCDATTAGTKMSQKKRVHTYFDVVQPRSM